MTASGAENNPLEGSVEPSARDRILVAATRLFLESGFEGTSVTKIAKAAKMTPANMYWHFKSKQDILAEVLKTLYRRSASELSAAIPEGTPVEQLSAYVRTYVAIQLTALGAHSNFGYASLASSLPPEGQDDLFKLGRPYIEILRQILKRGIEDGSFKIENLRVTSFAISTVCEYIFTWFRESEEMSAEEVAEHYVRIVLQMVLAPGPN
jgi:AcrR family transcriptional regulator